MFSRQAPLLSFFALSIVGCATPAEEKGSDPTSIVGGWSTFIKSIDVPAVDGCGFNLYLTEDRRYAMAYYCWVSRTVTSNSIQAEAGTYTNQGGQLALASQRSSCYVKNPTLETYAYELDDIGWRMALLVRPEGDSGSFPTIVVDNKGHMRLGSGDGRFDLTHFGGTLDPNGRNSFGCFSPNGTFKSEGGNLTTADINLIYEAPDDK